MRTYMLYMYTQSLNGIGNHMIYAFGGHWSHGIVQLKKNFPITTFITSYLFDISEDGVSNISSQRQHLLFRRPFSL